MAFHDFLAWIPGREGEDPLKSGLVGEVAGWPRRKVGVLGGMGPEATSAFFGRLVELTPASKDQEHLVILVVCQPSIPDRVAHFLGDGESPLSQVRQAMQQLERVGSEFIAIPCNTVHALWDEMISAVSIPILNILDETAEQVSQAVGPRPANPRVGVLATAATLALELYQRGLEKRELIPVVPTPEVQRKVSRAIKLIKSSQDQTEATQLLQQAVDFFRQEGAGQLIYGCTELGLVPVETPLRVFDSLEILAQATVEVGLGLRPLPAVRRDGLVPSRP